MVLCTPASTVLGHFNLRSAASAPASLFRLCLPGETTGLQTLDPGRVFAQAAPLSGIFQSAPNPRGPCPGPGPPFLMLFKQVPKFTGEATARKVGGQRVCKHLWKRGELVNLRLCGVPVGPGGF